MLTIVNNVDHAVHVDNVGKGDKIDKLISLSKKILTMLKISTTMAVLSMLPMLTILTQVDIVVVNNIENNIFRVNKIHFTAIIIIFPLSPNMEEREDLYSFCVFR